MLITLRDSTNSKAYSLLILQHYPLDRRAYSQHGITTEVMEHRGIPRGPMGSPTRCHRKPRWHAVAPRGTSTASHLKKYVGQLMDAVSSKSWITV